MIQSRSEYFNLLRKPVSARYRLKGMNTALGFAGSSRSEVLYPHNSRVMGFGPTQEILEMYEKTGVGTADANR